MKPCWLAHLDAVRAGFLCVREEVTRFCDGLMTKGATVSFAKAWPPRRCPGGGQTGRTQRAEQLCLTTSDVRLGTERLRAVWPAPWGLRGRLRTCDRRLLVPPVPELPTPLLGWSSPWSDLVLTHRTG